MNDVEVDQSDVNQQALKLARAARTLPGNVFERRFLGRMPWPDMQFRESYLESTVEYIDGNTDQFFDPMPGEDISKGTSTDDQRNLPGRMAIPKARRWLTLWASTYNDEPRRTYFKKGERLTFDDPHNCHRHLRRQYLSQRPAIAGCYPCHRAI